MMATRKYGRMNCVRLVSWPCLSKGKESRTRKSRRISVSFSVVIMLVMQVVSYLVHFTGTVNNFISDSDVIVLIVPMIGQEINAISWH